MSHDAELLDRWRDGEQAAGSALLARHFRRLLRFFYGKVGEDAEDLIQATMLACIEARDRFRGEASFNTYLFAIARTTLYRYFRERERQNDFDPQVTSLRDLGTSPTGAIDRRERESLIRVAMAELPVEQQIMLELRYWEELPPRELATVFTLDPTTARTRLHRARVALREAVDRIESDPAVRAAALAEFVDDES